MATAVFVDTGFFIAAHSKNDDFHAAALREWKRCLRWPKVTTTAVLIECGDGFAELQRWLEFSVFLPKFLSDPLNTVIPVDQPLVDRAIALRSEREQRYVAARKKRQKFRPWGLTDCVSFVVMRERHIQEALTPDAHFIEARYRALLREKD